MLNLNQKSLHLILVHCYKCRNVLLMSLWYVWVRSRESVFWGILGTKLSLMPTFFLLWLGFVKCQTWLFIPNTHCVDKLFRIVYVLHSNAVCRWIYKCSVHLLYIWDIYDKWMHCGIWISRIFTSWLILHLFRVDSNPGVLMKH